MNTLFLIFSSVILSALCQPSHAVVPLRESELKTGLKPDSGCNGVKCTDDENSQMMCIKVNFKNLPFDDKTTYITMLNQCDFKHLTCHEGVHPLIVPMALCENEINSLKEMDNNRVKRAAKPQKKKPSKGRKSAKRRIIRRQRTRFLKPLKGRRQAAVMAGRRARWNQWGHWGHWGG